MTTKKLRFINEGKEELRSIPIIANADFGHTNPMFTFPIGGDARISVSKNEVKFEMIRQ